MPLDGNIERFTRTLPDAQEWRQILLDAAQYIRDHGWCQNALRSEDGRVCLHGAIATVIRVPGSMYDPREGWCLRKVRMYLGAPCEIDFNDAPERTAAEVIAALESAAYAP